MGSKLFCPHELEAGAGISPLRILLGQFQSLIIWILMAAGIVSGVLGEVADAITILVMQEEVAAEQKRRSARSNCTDVRPAGSDD